MAFDPALRHPLYVKWISKWERQRDAVEGEDRIKSSPRRTEYLPRLSGQGDEVDARFNPNYVITTYEEYIGRASFLNATGRTVEGLIGAIMRKDPEVVWPESQAEALESVGHGLESWDEVIDETLEEVVGVGRFGHLVDMPVMAFDEVEPFVATYVAEAITDWELGEVGGRKHTVRVNLFEKSGVMGEKKDKELDQYRVLRLGMPEPASEEEEKFLREQGIEEFLQLWGLTLKDFEEGPVYFQEVWLEVDEDVDSKEGKAKFRRVELSVPRVRGGALWREIPWTFFNPTGCKPKPDKPTLLDLTVINISHFRNRCRS